MYSLLDETFSYSYKSFSFRLNICICFQSFWEFQIVSCFEVFCIPVFRNLYFIPLYLFIFNGFVMDLQYQKKYFFA